MSLPLPPEIELEILSVFARASRYGQDRRPDGMLHKVDRLTGLPDSANDLLPSWRALRGERLALELRIVPAQLAQELLGLTGLARAEWPFEQAEAVPRLEARIRAVAMHLAERGVLNPRPPDDEGNPMPLGEDRMTMCFAITARGLKHALDRTRGTRWGERGRISILDSVPDDVRRRAPQWAQKEAQK